MKRTVERGEPLTEAVTKGSLTYTLNQIRRAFYRTFPETDAEYFWIVEIFSDHLIASSNRLPDDEYYYVTYGRTDGMYTFTPRDEWEVVELTYQPQTIVERLKAQGGQRMEESIEPTAVRLAEATAGKPRTIFIDVAEADAINGNGRRYRLAVLREAVAEARHHLHESLSQGRAILLGEEEHPTHKRQPPKLTETIVKWTDIWMDKDGWVRAQGEMIENSNGRDAIVTMDAGVLPGASLRGYGESDLIEENGRHIEEIAWLRFTGIDLVMQPSFEDAGVTKMESANDVGSGDKNTMANKDEPKEKDNGQLTVAELRAKFPEVAEGLLAEERDKAKLEAVRKDEEAKAEQKRLEEMNAARDAKLREALGLSETDDLEAAVAAQAKRTAELEEAENGRQVAAYIEKEVDGMKGYPALMQEAMRNAVKADTPKTVEEAKASIIKQRGVFDPMVAEMKLRAKGRIDVLGPVLESETGYPEYARVSYEVTESLRNHGYAKRRKLNEKDDLLPSEAFAKAMLERYDDLNKDALAAEAKKFNEAETTSDLSLPYSVLRAVMEEAYPELIAANIFDFGVITTNPTRVYYEAAFSGETGYAVAVTGSANVNATAADTWYAFSAGHKRLQFSGISMQPNGGGTAFTYGTDYLIDFELGKYMILSTGTMATATDYDFDYTYNAVRKGEGVSIERAKATLAYDTLTAAADRLALQITSEAIKFSRSQVGFDAVATSINLLVKQLRLLIDRNLIHKALAMALTVSSNSGGTWNSSSDSLQTLVEYIVGAITKVQNRYYTPTSIVMSKTRGNALGLWDGFTQAGERPGYRLNGAAGLLGYINEVPVFTSTEMPDGFVLVNNREVVQHRIYSPMELNGPFPVYDSTTLEMIASKEYYVEEYNGTIAPIPGKASVVFIS